MNENWPLRKLSELFFVETGTTPSTKEKKYWVDGRTNWVTPTDLSKIGSQIEIFDSDRRVTEIAVKECNLTLLPRGSIILSTRAPVGYVAVLRKEATLNQGCKALVPREEMEVSSEFYAYYLVAAKSKLQSLSGGSTFKELSKPALSNLEVPHPSLNEQRKIAQIMSTVDRAVQKTEHAVVINARVRTALLKDLTSGKVRHPEFA